MLKRRVIPCLDVDGGRVVKGTSFLNLQDAGDPAKLASRYDEEGADELVFLDITASSDRRDTLTNVVRNVSSEVFIPLTVGGGIRKVDDMRSMLEAGADKVAVNTAAVQDPTLIERCAAEFGSQCVVLAIDAYLVKDPAKTHSADGTEMVAESPWGVCTYGGRRPTALDPIKWACIGEELGAGEVLLTSMDADGRKSGYDLPLLEAISGSVGIPVIASGGAGTPRHLADAIRAGADAVLLASIIHFGNYSVGEIKKQLSEMQIPIRAV